MHLLIAWTSSKVGRGLANARADVCMLGLVTLQESWPASGWIHRLFASIRERLNRKLSHEAHSTNSSTTPRASFARTVPADVEMVQTSGPLEDSGLEYGEKGLFQWPLDQYRTGAAFPQQPLDLTDSFSRECFPNLFGMGDMGYADELGFFEALNIPR